LQTNHAADYANSLLSEFGCSERVDVQMDHPAMAWKRSGLLQTTKLMLPCPLASHVDGALLALKALLRAGGYGRLMDTVDGRIALNLVRDDDWDLIPAWLEDYVDDWAGITRLVANRQSSELVARAAEIGLAVAEDRLPKRPETWFDVKRFEKAKSPKTPLIVDLSSLWAGPLASSLLQMTGAEVIKVESPTRPDGMRLGHEGFYRLLNANKDCSESGYRH